MKLQNREPYQRIWEEPLCGFKPVFIKFKDFSLLLVFSK